MACSPVPRAVPGQRTLAPDACFPALPGWVLSLWRSSDLALAVDVTTHTDQLTAIVISVLYRGRAIPVAWELRPGHRDGAFMPGIIRLLARLAPVMPPGLRVTLAADRGLWSPALYAGVRRWGWQPLLRVPRDVQVWPGKRHHVAAHRLVPGPGHAWVGRARAHTDPRRQLRLPVLVVWEGPHTEPWVIFSDLAPQEAGLRWYGLRCWIEGGFRDLKRLGWQWERTRRRDPARVARHWLVLAIATVWTLATGTAQDEADRVPRPAGLPRPRPLSVLQRGRFHTLRLLRHATPPVPLALTPEPWPTHTTRPRLRIVYWHDPDDPAPATPPSAASVKHPL
jgi:hypothetical protein